MHGVNKQWVKTELSTGAKLNASLPSKSCCLCWQNFVFCWQRSIPSKTDEGVNESVGDAHITQVFFFFRWHQVARTINENGNECFLWKCFPFKSFLFLWFALSTEVRQNMGMQTDHSANIVYKKPEKETFCSLALWNVKYNPKHKTMKVAFNAQRKRTVIRPKIEHEQEFRRTVGSTDIQNSVCIIRFRKENLCSANSDFQFELRVMTWSSGSDYQVSVAAVIKVRPGKSFTIFSGKLFKGLEESLLP